MHKKEEVPDLKVNAWYLDEGTLCGLSSDLERALENIEEMGAQRGLTLNRTKSLLYIPPDADTSENTLPKEILICREGFTLLGCPIGPPNNCNSIFTKRVQKVKDILSKLPDSKDSQMEVTLLRSCLAVPKIMISLILSTFVSPRVY